MSCDWKKKKKNKLSASGKAIGHFADAILHFVANSHDKSINASSFSSDVFPAFEIMFNQWLQSKETKVPIQKPGVFF
jgi:hypothetical protein